MADLDPADYPDAARGFVRVSHTVDGSIRHFTAHVSLLDQDPSLRPLKQAALNGNGEPLPPKYDAGLTVKATEAQPTAEATTTGADTTDTTTDAPTKTPATRRRATQAPKTT